MQSVIDSIAWSARSLCVIGKNADFVTFFIELYSKLCQRHADMWELEYVIGQYKRNSLVKILKEKFGNLKTCRYIEYRYKWIALYYL